MSFATLVEALVSVLVVLGAGFSLIGSLGLARMPDFFTRLHGPSKATTLGIGSLLVASVIHLSARGPDLSLQEFMIPLFIAITTPVSAHLLAKAAQHRRLPGCDVGTRTRDDQDRKR